MGPLPTRGVRWWFGVHRWYGPMHQVVGGEVVGEGREEEEQGHNHEEVQEACVPIGGELQV